MQIKKKTVRSLHLLAQYAETSRVLLEPFQRKHAEAKKSTPKCGVPDLTKKIPPHALEAATKIATPTGWSYNCENLRNTIEMELTKKKIKNVHL